MNTRLNFSSDGFGSLSPSKAQLVGLVACVALGLSACSTTSRQLPVSPSSVTITDAANGRQVPVALYGLGRGERPLAVISNGYGGNNTAYAFIAEALVRRGYLVAAVQQDLPSDPPMPQGGENLAERRRPHWAVGVSAILAVQRTLRAQGAVSEAPMVLVGHSNGGDISMLLAQERPDAVRMVFSLDNRRMPLPRTARPRVCSLRSSDQPADRGVLPSPEEAAGLGIQITQAVDLQHNDMWDGAAPPQKAQMLEALGRCLAAS